MSEGLPIDNIIATHTKVDLEFSDVPNLNRSNVTISLGHWSTVGHGLHKT